LLYHSSGLDCLRKHQEKHCFPCENLHLWSEILHFDATPSCPKPILTPLIRTSQKLWGFQGGHSIPCHHRDSVASLLLQNQWLGCGFHTSAQKKWRKQMECHFMAKKEAKNHLKSIKCQMIQSLFGKGQIVWSTFDPYQALDGDVFFQGSKQLRKYAKSWPIHPLHSMILNVTHWNQLNQP
jgi:hypothetical protein